MNTKQTIGIALVTIALVSGCSRDTPPTGNQVYRTTSHAQVRAARTSAVSQGNEQRMIRQVSGIMQSVEQANRRLADKLEALEDEQRQLERLRRDAKNAFIAGQPSDYRIWQRIARDKYRNVRDELARVENTVAAVHRNVQMELRRVSWVSGGARREHLQEVDSLLAQLLQWQGRIDRAAENAGRHQKWLSADL